MTIRHMPPEDERRAIAADLWAYGEDELAERAASLSDAQLNRLGELASDWSGASGARLLSTATALAAIEVMEGKPRPLARQRRRPFARNPYERN